MASARVPRDMEKGESLEVTHPEFELLADPPGCLPTAADRTGSAPARSWGGRRRPHPAAASRSGCATGGGRDRQGGAAGLRA